MLWFTGLSGPGRAPSPTRVHEELVRRGHGGRVHRRRRAAGGVPQHRLHPGRAGGAPPADRIHGEPAGGPRGHGGGVVRLAVPRVARLHPAAVPGFRRDLRGHAAGGVRAAGRQGTVRPRPARGDSQLHGDRRPVRAARAPRADARHPRPERRRSASRRCSSGWEAER